MTTLLAALHAPILQMARMVRRSECNSADGLGSDYFQSSRCVEHRWQRSYVFTKTVRACDNSRNPCTPW